MGNMLTYKGYHAAIEFDQEDMLLVGEVFGIQDSLNFHGRSVEEVEEMFHQSIDNYLELCKEMGKQPDKEFKGSFNVRIDPKLHRAAALAAKQRRVTLNEYVETAIRDAVSQTERGPVYLFSDLFQATVLPKVTRGAVVPSSTQYMPSNKQFCLKGESIYAI